MAPDNLAVFPAQRLFDSDGRRSVGGNYTLSIFFASHVCQGDKIVSNTIPKRDVYDSLTAPLPCLRFT
jgi:hypothetical protein